MQKESAYENSIVFGENVYLKLNNFLTGKDFSKVFIFTDENTVKNCLPRLLSQITSSIKTEIIETESGENNKDIGTCEQLWKTLTDLGGDRTSLIINLGGGLLTDMGGFVAATFLRGIPFINIPTTLLGMVDAAIGGKTGVNREGLKNQIGLFRFAALTLIDTTYLETLPQRQLKSGLAEILKHGLIRDLDYWNTLKDLQKLTLADLENIVRRSVQLKLAVTQKDTRERGLRKQLNFGHTLGHAIESYCLKSPNRTTLLHGEAVAIGIVLESYLSHQLLGLSKNALEEIKEVILHTFPKEPFTQNEIRQIIALMNYDKKNDHGKINFVLLNAIGKARIDCQVPQEEIEAAFAYYQK